MQKPRVCSSLSTIDEDMESTFAPTEISSQPPPHKDGTRSSISLHEIFAQPSAAEYWSLPWKLNDFAVEHIKVNELYSIIHDAQTDIAAFEDAARTLYQTHVICMASIPLSKYANEEWIAHYDVCHALLALMMDAERRFIDLQRVLVRNGDELGNDLGVDNSWLVGLRAYLVLMKELLVEKFRVDRSWMVLRFEREHASDCLQ